jgi:uncharacterized membrane protein (UPF0127 family)
MTNNLFSITINGTAFHLAVADDDASRKKGLSGFERLGKNKGMLFIFPEPIVMNMVMRDMNFDLDFLFLDKDWDVVDSGSLSKDDTKGIHPNKAVTMVVELPKGTIQRLSIISGATAVKPETELLTLTKAIKRFKSGGKFELIGEKAYDVKEDDIKAEAGMLQILNDKGEVVANIEPGSRIFSRIHTQDLIKKFKNGDKLALAKLMVEILDIQDSQEPDYVKN